MNGTTRTWPALDLRPTSDLLLAALTDCDATAIDESIEGRWRVFFSTAEARDRAAARLRHDVADVTIAAVDVPDENWAARSQAALRATRVDRITVAPPWDVPTDLADGAITIVIQPSMGFGTGHHATTRLCLLELQRLDLAGLSVLDVGTGSGVLAIAASLLGAAVADGFDDDRDAVQSARENARLNPKARATFTVSDLQSANWPAADVVVANLTGGLLIAAASRLRQMVAEGGVLILSGLVAAEEPEVLAAFAGLWVERRGQEDEWMCLTLRSVPSRAG